MKINNCMFCNSVITSNLGMWGVWTTFGGKDVEGYAVHCDGCGCRGPVKGTKRTAAKHWNKILNEIEKLEGE